MTWPQRPELFRRYGVRPPRGALLHGPPGTGKTALARAAAASAGAALFVLNGPDVVSEFYGDSEAGLRGKASENVTAWLLSKMSVLIGRPACKVRFFDNGTHRYVLISEQRISCQRAT